MINAIIIDDEVSACRNLERLLLLVKAPVAILDKIHDAPTAIKQINNLKPDLIFLDIQLPTGSGFSILESIEQKDIHVVFITAHSEFALKAFKYSAIDYLLKPINIDELKHTITKIEKTLHYLGQAERNEALLLNHAISEHQKIVINTEQGYRVIAIDQIIRLQSDSNYTHFFLKNGSKVTASKLLKSYSFITTDHNFMRIHRSHIINMDCVLSYTKGMKPKVLMTDQVELEISRDKKEAFFQLLEKL